MSTSKQFLPGLLLACCLAACGPMLVEPELTISASPRTLDGVAQKATIKVVAVDDKAKPGTGKVRITSVAGSLKDGIEIDLLAGEGTTDFTCVRATDPACTGAVRLNAEWVVSGKLVSVSTSVTVTASVVDAGTDAGTGDDGGTDAGVDAGVDAGMAVVTLTSAKPTLITGTGDSTVLTAQVLQGGVPVTGASVVFTTSRGSFAAAPGTTTITSTTDATGNALATLHASNAVGGTAMVTASSGGITANAVVTFANVANLVVVTSAQTATYLVVRNAGSAAIGTTMTTLFWRVTDSAGMGVPNVSVSFAINPGSAAGATVTPQATTDAQGNLSVTLSSGDSPGSVTVRGTVDATAGSASEISVALSGPPIIYGVPSDSDFTFTCARKNLGALHVTPAAPPTRNVNTPCSITVRDRNGTPIPGSIPVQFLQEVGSFMPSPSVIVTGSAVVQYNAISNELPADVAPLPGEPSSGTKNPRDMLVTLVAIVAGEEQFYDGSGASNNVTNGRWDPGEWFVDLGEPFSDDNDNGVWDVDEKYFDTEPKNMRWDGPNGVWDNNVQIFRTTHVLWTGPSSRPIEFETMPPFVIGNAPLITGFTVGDEFLNPISPDSSAATATLIGTTKGTVSLATSSFQLDTLAVPITTEPPLQATETAMGSGVFVVNGNCNPSGPAPASALTRCIRRYRFANTGWSRGSTGTATFVNAAGAASAGAVRFDISHGFSGTASQTFPVTFNFQ